MKKLIVPQGSDMPRKIRMASERIESEYQDRLKVAIPMEAAKLRKEMKRKINQEKRKIILDFVRNRPRSPNVLW